MEHNPGISGTKQIILFVVEEWKLLIVLTVLFSVYFYYTSTFDYFEKRSIKYMKPTIFLGNLGKRLLLKQSFHDLQLSIYSYFKGSPFGGIFEGRKPILYIFDPDVIKAVTIRDFDHFVDRNTINTGQPKYLSRSLLNLKGTEWKDVRSSLTPAFSSARLKNMFPLIEYCSQQMVEYLKKFDKKNVEMKDTMGHFTLELIGACAFGIKCGVLTGENAHFIKVAEKFNYMPVSKRLFIFFLLIFAPQMFRFLNISFLNLESTKELVEILKKAKAERRSSKSRRNDFLQLLIDATKKEKNGSINDNTDIISLDDDTIDAQALLFLIAGYETSSTLLSFAIYVLATNPDLQEKLRLHIEEVTNEKEMTYELLSQVTYLEAFLLETLRMYPPVARLDRTCTKKYTLPGTSINLDVGNVVALPVYGIHMDPDIYTEPHLFRPERFMGEEKKNRPAHLYLPFGVGPRNCIGLRFAMFSTKTVMISLLKNFKFSICPQTKVPIKFERGGFLLKAVDGVWVHLETI